MSRWLQRVPRCGIGARSFAPAPKVVVKDTVGAGDAFMAGLMVGLTRGADTQTVLETACRLGAIVASHDGATPLLPQELIQEFRANLKLIRPRRRAYLQCVDRSAVSLTCGSSRRDGGPVHRMSNPGYPFLLGPASVTIDIFLSN